MTKSSRLWSVLTVCLFMLFCAREASARILVIAPHPDDDVITSAGIIYSAVKRGEPVKVVYMTNGDLYGQTIGYQREDEAVNAQVNFLGPVENDLMFLGYPDGHLQDIYESYTASTDKLTTSYGQSTTYGDRGLGRSDYHFYKFGSHALYNRYYIVQDLQSIIQTFKPDHIYTTSEYDHHSDHSTTFLLLKMALAAVTSADPNYKPVVHKTIVWSGHEDIWPAATDPTTYEVEIPDLSLTPLVWANRESIDVPAAMQSTYLYGNPKYNAVEAHVSQAGPYGSGSFIARFVHKDEIFWAESATGSNQPPIVNAGSDATVNEGVTVQLNGSASRDPENGTLTYQWTQAAGPSVTLSSANTAYPSFVAPTGLTHNQVLTFQLVVNDGTYSSSADLVNITVTASNPSPNVAPTASVVASSQNTANGQLAIKAVDGVADGYPGDYTREWATTGQGVGAWITLTWANPYVVDRVILNDRPNGSDQITGGTLTFSDGSTVAIGPLDNSGKPVEFTFAPRTVTSVKLTVTAVSSSTSNVGLAEFQVFGTPGANFPPVANAGPDQTVTENMSVQLNGSASYDPNNDPLASYQWTQTGGNAVSLANATSAYPSFVSPSGLTHDEMLTFQLVVSDGTLTSSADSVNVTVTAANPSPNIAPTASVTASSQNTGNGQLAVKAVDGVIDGYPGDYTREWATQSQGAGAWIMLAWSNYYIVDRVVLYDRPNSNDQILSGTLTFSDGSTVAVGPLDNSGKAVVIDFAPRTVSSVKLTVNSVSSSTGNVGLAEFQVYGTMGAGINLPPVANAGTDQTVAEGASVQLNGSGSSDPNNDPLSYQWTQTAGTPVVLSNPNAVNPGFVAPTGLTENAVLTFQLVVSDGTLTSAADSVNVTVTAASPSTNIAPLAIVAASSQNAGTGQLAIKAVDGVVDGYPGDYTREWATQGQGVGAWITLSWGGAYLVDRVVLYDRPNGNDQILSGTLTFSDGSTVPVGQLNNNGTAVEISFAPRVVTGVTLTVTSVSSSTSNIGLSEFQVFGQ
jgi:LmbE family N-acetylglucosaminyl deacetylase